MPEPEVTSSLAKRQDAKSSFHSARIAAIGQSLAGLDPGPLADLRRMSLAGRDAGAPYFYRLAAKHDLPHDQEVAWARIVKLMAILTEKGRDEHKASPHNGWRGLGSALCDGGDANWPAAGETLRPLLSENRLARLLAAKGETRAALLERAIRMLATCKPPRAGVNCADLALLLDDDDPEPVRKIARDYYRRLDVGNRRVSGDETDDTSGADA